MLIPLRVCKKLRSTPLSVLLCRMGVKVPDTSASAVDSAAPPIRMHAEGLHQVFHGAEQDRTRQGSLVDQAACLLGQRDVDRDLHRKEQHVK